MSKFVHLHLHSEYSLLDSFVRIKDLPEQLKKNGQRAVSLTDKSNLFGAVDFFLAMKNVGLKPIIGAELNVAKEKVLCYVKNNIGYTNLVKLVSKAQEMFDKDFIIDEDFFFEHSEGLIIIIGFSGFDLNFFINSEKKTEAKKILKKYREVFQKDDLYLQISRGLNPDDDKYFQKKIKFSNEFFIPLAATNEVYYLKKDEATYRDILKCIGNSNKLSDKNREKLPSDEYYLKTENEMRKLFSDIPEAIENTSIIAEKCNFEFDFSKHYLPKFELPEGVSSRDKLKELCFTGLKKRYKEEDIKNNPEIQERLNYELDLINKMGFNDYFLICYDFVNYAKSKDILVGPARGSGGGSLACYVLNITDIDPIKHDLIFERFLNPERISMPDLDIDFQDDRRHEVIEYVSQKYGAGRVAQIVTFGTLSARAIVRDVSRVLDLKSVDAMAKSIPNNLNMTLNKALEISPEFKRISNSSRLHREVLDISLKLEGLPRHTSTHAAGIVIFKTNITDIVPTFYQGEQLSTQYNMKILEKLGLLKMDFLGLRYLSVINNSLKIIEKNRGIKIKIEEIDYKDKKTFKLISSGRTTGVFQLESAGMIKFLKMLKPESVEDIIVGISLYRPGPMDSIPLFIENKNNAGKIKYLHPMLKPILAETYGCIVYQEQVMEIVRTLAGFSYGRSDIIRRAMSKKNIHVMEEERKNFIYGLPEQGVVGALNNGIPEDICNKIYDDMVDFAKYAFNKSHATGYAYISYRTAYLKANYPAEYMAALLSSSSGSLTSVSKYIKEANAMGIKVLPPSVQKSKKQFTVENNSIRYGLSAIKNVGTHLIDNIIKLQGKNFPLDLFDFYKALDKNNLNRKSAESLILSGALDVFKLNMATMIENFENMFGSAHSFKTGNSNSQMSLMDLSDDDVFKIKPDIERMPEYDKNYIEKCRLNLIGVSKFSSEKDLTYKSVYIRVKRFDSEEKRFFERLKKADDGYTLYIFDLSKNKMREYIDKISFNNSVKETLIKRYGKENIVIK